MTVAVLFVIALGLTLTVALMPGTQYPLDAAAVVAWMGFSYEVAYR